MSFVSSLMFLPKMESITISRCQVLLCTPSSDAFLQRSFKRLSRHLSIWREWAHVRKFLDLGLPPPPSSSKKNGIWRPSGDHHQWPNIADVMSNLHGARIFSKLDLVKEYHQPPVYPEDMPKTAIIAPFGTYTFNFCFGMKNSGATFQCLMDGILRDLKFCVCYAGDILIFSCSLQQHQRHLRTMLE